MLKKIANLPVRALAFVAAKIMGRNTAPAADPPPPPPRRKPTPRPAAAEPERGGGHDHGHDHGGGHDHGHDHGGAKEPAEAAPQPAATDAPEKGQKEASEKEAPAPKKATKKVDVVAEETPNPNARKFTCSVAVVEKGSLTFATEAEAAGHPLGKAIWDVGGVKSVFAVKDFVTVTKTDDADWAKLVPKLTRAIKGAL